MGKKKKEKKPDKSPKPEKKKEKKTARVKNFDGFPDALRETVYPASPDRGGSRNVSSEDRKRAADVFRVLADENRLRILELLKGRELCAAELLQSMDIVQSTLSHHMKFLCEAGLVTCTRKGRKACYCISRDCVAWISEYFSGLRQEL